MAHITVGTTSTRADYTASSSQTAFSVPFEFFDEDDLLVYKNNVLLTKTTNYTVTPVTTSDGGFDGGTVTLTSGAALNDKVAIVLSMPYERSSDFPTAGPFNVTTLNTTLDKNAVRFKQLDELSSRAIKGPVSEGALEELPKATDRASRIMSFDSSGNPTTVATDSLSLATLQAFTDYRLTTATGNGSTTAFTLSADPGQEGNTQVYIDGIYQSKSNYSISGTTLTFSTAPPNTSAIEIVHGQAASTYAPGNNSIAYENLLTSDIDTDLSSVSGSDDTLASAKAIKTYVDAQVDTVDTLAEVLGNGNTTTTTQKINFRDSGIYLNSSTDGQLDIVADGEVQIAATTIDINGAVALNGAITGATNITLSGELDAATLDISGNADIDGITNLDQTQIDGSLSVGQNDTGFDVQFFGATSGAYVLWDESADKFLTAGGATVDIVKDKLLIGGTAVTTTAAELNVLDAVTAGTVAASKAVVVDANKDAASFRNLTLTGELDAATLDISGNADIDGTTNLDAVDIDGAVQADSTITVGVDDTGYDVKFFGATSGKYMLWDESADSLLVAGNIGIGAVPSYANLQITEGAGTLPSETASGATLLQLQNNSSTSDNVRLSLIAGTAGQSNIAFGDSGDENVGSIYYNHSSNLMGLRTSGAGVDLTISSGGNIAFPTDGVVLSFGADSEISITHVADKGLIIAEGDAGSWAAPANFDTLVVESGSNGGIVLGVPDADEGVIGISSPTTNGGIGYGMLWDYNAGIGRLFTSKVGGKTRIEADNQVTQVTFDGAAGSQFAEFANDIGLKSDSSKLYFGADNEVTVTHVADVGLNFASTRSGADSIFRFSNSANAAASDVRLIIQNGGTSGGDPLINLDGQATNATWSVGVDTSAAKFVIADADKGGFDGSDEVFTIATGGSTTITTADNNAQLTLVSTDADANGGPVLDLWRNSSSPADADFVGEIYFHGEDDAGNKQEYASIKTRAVDVSSGSEDGRLEMYNSLGGSMKSVFLSNNTATPEVVINEDSEDINFRVESNGNANQLFVDAGNNRVGIGLSNPSGPLHIYDATDMKLLLEGSGSPNINLVSSSGDDYLVQNHAGLFRIRNHADNRDDISVTGDGAATFGASVVAKTDTDTSNTGSVTLDFTANQNFVLTLTGNVTLANPTTERVGASGVIVCIQDGTGSRTLSLGSQYKTSGDAGITLSTGANDVDIIPYFVQAADNILLGAVQKDFVGA